MANTNAIEHLLKTEAKAVALVNEAQGEADKRIQENEEKNRAYYEDQNKLEIDKRKLMLEDEKERIKEIYQRELDNYKDEISRVSVNTQEFNCLINKLIDKG